MRLIHQKTGLLFISLLYSLSLIAQHNNELYNDGGLIHIESGAEVSVWGDLHMIGATAELQNNGLIVVQGNSYSDALFQQSGTGTYQIANTDVNIGERQFISGSFAVRGTGSSNIGIDDGSFYDLELNNDQGIVYLVGSGNVADVRNSVDFSVGARQNRIVTHDIGTTGSITHPDNGSDYTGVFGLLNSTAGTTNLKDNAIASYGNMSSVDSAYIQGKFRRAVSSSAGDYEFTLGLEPDGAGQKRGIQYIRLDLGANSYDVITGYFQADSSNTMTSQGECNGYEVDYFGGADHGQWVFTDATGSGSGNLAVWVWPQDHNMPIKTVYLITKDNSITGTTNECSASSVGLTRSGFSSLGAFGIAAGDALLPVDLVSFKGRCHEQSIHLGWTTESESDNDFFTIEKSVDGFSFTDMAHIPGAGNKDEHTDYKYIDRSFNQRTTYYRLSQTDFDGRETYFDIIAVNCETTALTEVQIYPNPTKEYFTVVLPEQNTDEHVLSLFDLTGRVVDLKTIAPDFNPVEFDVSNLTVGTYFLEVKSGASVSSFKVIKW
jgi:hypothetical protein